MDASAALSDRQRFSPLLRKTDGTADGFGNSLWSQLVAFGLGAMRAAEAWLTTRGKIEPGYVDSAFPQQKAFILDEAKQVAALCGRRAGKSMALAGRLLRTAVRHPGAVSLYISQTRNNSRMIVGRALMNLSRLWGLGLVLKEIDARLHVIHPNGHHSWLAGAHHREAFEDFRGHAFSEVQIDEAQFHGPYLREAVEEVLEPALGDLDGALVVSGTPSPMPIGFFHSVTTGLDSDEFGNRIPQYETHCWTMAENTFFRNGKGEKYREEVRLKRNWAPTHPTFLREYMGEWVRDDNAIVFPYDSEKNAFAELPDLPLIKVLAIDIGYEDATAFVLLGYTPGSPKIYVLEVWRRSHLIPSAIAAHIEEWRRRHKPGIIVADAGALGKGFVAEFNERYGLGVQAADKHNKVAYAEMLRGDFLSGTILINPFTCRDLLDELALLSWNEDRDGFDDRFRDDTVHALIYGWRACKAHYRPEFEGPKPGSPEWINNQVRDVKAERAKEIAKKARHKSRQSFR